ncbi:ammonium transporter [Desulfurobacterium thermolithotrophum DSM 11699]|uniref:Ammonium transporter n=1 Tax=Desulfurobacterium thermolithotrophum (strain DSM 11699 / BSA) TaxID=868864 RepID=F0S3Z6_DESTD|nr:ammonium transporter [Desulfurobacterium thermolithotrophum]ADY73568.1 ammonium transporter [Desulfurobacterium thermolithotrophum DSM 11699]
MVEESIKQLIQSLNVFYLLAGAVMILSMHAGFAFLEAGTVRKKNQVNALVKIIVDVAVATLAYFFIGYPLAHKIGFIKPAAELVSDQGFELVRFFFLLMFAACISAIVSGGVAERMKFRPYITAGFFLAGIIYPIFEALIWGERWSPAFQGWIEKMFGAPIHDFAGSMVVHGLGGWIALPAVIILGPRMGRYIKDQSKPIPISNIPYLALGSWILIIGWFGFNVMSSQSIESISGLVAVNSLMATAGGLIGGVLIGKNDPGFIHNGALAGLVAICAGSDIVNPISAFFIGFVAAWIFVKAFIWEQEKLKIDDVLGVWPLHGINGVWGGIAAGIFGQEALGGLGGVSIISQFVGVLLTIIYAVIAGFVLYKVLDVIFGLRLSEEEEFNGSDLSIHKVDAYPEDSLKV